MRRNQCVICGQAILKSGQYDPFLCRDCEKQSESMEVDRYWYLDEI